MAQQLQEYPKGTAVVGFAAQLISRTDGTDITTGTVTVNITKDGGTQTAATNSPVHEGNGQWTIDLTADEMDADIVAIQFTHASAITRTYRIKTVDTSVTVSSTTVPAPTTSVAGHTILEAVNDILEGVGEEPVAALDTGGSSDAAQAETILGRVKREVLLEGWNFNTEGEDHEPVYLAVDTNNYVPLASNVLSVDTVGEDKDVNAVRRGTYLYNLDDQTFEWADYTQVAVQRVLDIDFEDVPPAVKLYIVKKAMIRFQKAAQGSRTQDALLKEDMIYARVQAHREHDRTRDKSLLNTIHQANRMRGAIGRSRQRHYY